MLGTTDMKEKKEIPESHLGWIDATPLLASIKSHINAKKYQPFSLHVFEYLPLYLSFVYFGDIK